MRAADSHPLKASEFDVFRDADRYPVGRALTLKFDDPLMPPKPLVTSLRFDDRPELLGDAAGTTLTERIDPLYGHSSLEISRNRMPPQIAEGPFARAEFYSWDPGKNMDHVTRTTSNGIEQSVRALEGVQERHPDGSVLLQGREWTDPNGVVTRFDGPLVTTFRPDVPLVSPPFVRAADLDFYNGAIKTLKPTDGGYNWHVDLGNYWSYHNVSDGYGNRTEVLGVLNRVDNTFVPHVIQDGDRIATTLPARDGASFRDIDGRKGEEVSFHGSVDGSPTVMRIKRNPTRLDDNGNRVDDPPEITQRTLPWHQFEQSRIDAVSETLNPKTWGESVRSLLENAKTT